MDNGHQEPKKYTEAELVSMSKEEFLALREQLHGRQDGHLEDTLAPDPPSSSRGFDVVGPQPQHATGGPVVVDYGFGAHGQGETSSASASSPPPIQPQQDKTMAVECRFTLVVVGHERDALKAAAAAERILRTGLHEPGLALSASINVYGDA